MVDNEFLSPGVSNHVVAGRPGRLTMTHCIEIMCSRVSPNVSDAGLLFSGRESYPKPSNAPDVCAGSPGSVVGILRSWFFSGK